VGECGGESLRSGPRPSAKGAPLSLPQTKNISGWSVAASPSAPSSILTRLVSLFSLQPVLALRACLYCGCATTSFKRYCAADRRGRGGESGPPLDTRGGEPASRSVPRQSTLRAGSPIRTLFRHPSTFTSDRMLSLFSTTPHNPLTPLEWAPRGLPVPTCLRSGHLRRLGCSSLSHSSLSQLQNRYMCPLGCDTRLYASRKTPRLAITTPRSSCLTNYRITFFD